MGEDNIYSALLEIKDKINDNHMEILGKLDDHMERFHRRVGWMCGMDSWKIISVCFGISLIFSGSILAIRSSAPDDVLHHSALLTKGVINAN